VKKSVCGAFLCLSAFFIPKTVHALSVSVSVGAVTGKIFVKNFILTSGSAIVQCQFMRLGGSEVETQGKDLGVEIRMSQKRGDFSYNVKMGPERFMYWNRFVNYGKCFFEVMLYGKDPFGNELAGTIYSQEASTRGNMTAAFTGLSARLTKILNPLYVGVGHHQHSREIVVINNRNNPF